MHKLWHTVAVLSFCCFQVSGWSKRNNDLICVEGSVFPEFGCLTESTPNNLTMVICFLWGLSGPGSELRTHHGHSQYAVIRNQK
ncbi:hypothetical protein Pelo_3683 [Pelomyxa schiedti]|nr:hypothetical protein Pelo_3683 [Pelomyxa schiedti]